MCAWVVVVGLVSVSVTAAEAARANTEFLAVLVPASSASPCGHRIKKDWDRAVCVGCNLLDLNQKPNIKTQNKQYNMSNPKLGSELT